MALEEFYITRKGLENLKKQLNDGCEDTKCDKLTLSRKIKDSIVIEEMKEYIHFIENRVIPGSCITISCDLEEPETYVISGSEEGNSLKGILSTQSPMVQALLFKEVGDIIPFNHCSIEIIEVKKHLFT